jgi:hypothetical protein
MNLQTYFLGMIYIALFVLCVLLNDIRRDIKKYTKKD